MGCSWGVRDSKCGVENSSFRFDFRLSDPVLFESGDEHFSGFSRHVSMWAHAFPAHGSQALRKLPFSKQLMTRGFLCLLVANAMLVNPWTSRAAGGHRPSYPGNTLTLFRYFASSIPDLEIGGRSERFPSWVSTSVSVSVRLQLTHYVQDRVMTAIPCHEKSCSPIISGSDKIDQNPWGQTSGPCPETSSGVAVEPAQGLGHVFVQLLGLSVRVDVPRDRAHETKGIVSPKAQSSPRLLFPVPTD